MSATCPRCGREFGPIDDDTICSDCLVDEGVRRDILAQAQPTHVLRLRCPSCGRLAAWIDRHPVGGLWLRYMHRRSLGDKLFQAPVQRPVIDPRAPAPPPDRSLLRRLLWGDDDIRTIWPCPRCPRYVTTRGADLVEALDRYDHTGKVQTVAARVQNVVMRTEAPSAAD